MTKSFRMRKIAMNIYDVLSTAKREEAKKIVLAEVIGYPEIIDSFKFLFIVSYKNTIIGHNKKLDEKIFIEKFFTYSFNKVNADKPKKWSQEVTQKSDALDLEPGVFSFDDPVRIAKSLKESADKSERRKAPPFRSAMSMLTFYINRAGRRLPEAQKKCLEAAKDELRELYGRPRKGSKV